MPILCTLVVGAFQWHVVNQMVESRTIGRQIRNTQVDLGVFRYTLSDAESAQFRYILTQNPGDLDLYHKLIAQTNDRFTELRQLTSGNTLQTNLLNGVEPLLRTKEANADKSFSLENSGNHQGALQLISSDDGRQRMLQIEKGIDDMEFVSAQQVLQRQYISAHNLKVSAAASIAGLAVNLICIAAVLLIIRRLQGLQATVTRDALRELINYEDGKLTIEEYLSRRAAALSAHGQAQIEAEKLISQLERRRSRTATTKVQPSTPPQ